MQSSNISNVWRPRPSTAPNSPLERFRRPTQSAEQGLFLKRLQDLLDKRRQHAGCLAGSDWRRRLIDKALYSTYRDCLSLGVGEQARDILRQPQAAPAG
jgi:hypothetical protein